MGYSIRQLATLGVIAPLMAACVKASTYHHDLADTRAQITAEQQARMNADSSQNADVAGVKSDLAGVKTDVQGLRNDLQSLRTEFGAKITALESGIQFDFPVNFAFDDAAIRDQDHDALDRFASVVQKYYPGTKITIEGFADPGWHQDVQPDAFAAPGELGSRLSRHQGNGDDGAQDGRLRQDASRGSERRAR